MIYYTGHRSADEDLGHLLNSGVLAFDVESTGLKVHKDEPIGVSLASKDDCAFYTVPYDHLIAPLLADDSKLKIAFNAKFDHSMMKKAGIEVNNLCDPMIAAHLLEETELSLFFLVAKYLETIIRTYADLDKPLTEMTMQEQAEYSGPHSYRALDLWNVLELKLRALRLDGVFWNVEMPLVPVLSDMELNGVMLDPEVLKSLGAEFDVKIDTYNKALDYWSNTSGVNFNSADQVADVFYKKLGIPEYWVKTDKGRASVSAEYFKTIQDKHPIIPVYLAFKQLKTLKNNYVKGLLRDMWTDGRVYGSFNQTRTRTGRLSSSDPNLQKIPQRSSEGKRIRTAFVAPEGSVLLKSDYDLLELKMMAICSKDENMLDAFRTGRDIHTETAVKVFGSKDRRPEGKTLDFQIIYGGGKLSHRDMFFVAYPGVGSWIAATISKSRNDRYTRTLNGRIRSIPEYVSSKTQQFSTRMVSHGDREVISTIVQGTSAEVVKIGMANVSRALRGSDVKMLMQVHDELVFEVPEGQVREVAEVVNKAMTYNEYEIPLTATIEVGKSWGEMEKLELGGTHG